MRDLRVIAPRSARSADLPDLSALWYKVKYSLVESSYAWCSAAAGRCSLHGARLGLQGYGLCDAAVQVDAQLTMAGEV